MGVTGDFSGLIHPTCLTFVKGGFRDDRSACERRSPRGEGGGYEIPRWVGLSEHLGTVRDWGCGGEAFKLGKDWPRIFGTGIWTERELGLGDFDMNNLLLEMNSIHSWTYICVAFTLEFHFTVHYVLATVCVYICTYVQIKTTVHVIPIMSRWNGPELRSCFYTKRPSGA